VRGDDGARHLLVEMTGVPAMGYRAYRVADAVSLEPAEMTITPRLLENAYYRIRLNEAGEIASLFDKDAGREVLRPGACGNVLRVVAECPAGGEVCGAIGGDRAEARTTNAVVDVVVEEAGPVRSTLRLRWRVGESTITQRLTLYRVSRRIDFRTELDWRETRRLLQVAFPVDVRATFATYEVQFGTVERPTHRNTPVDAARTEVPAQRWADLSEGNYGVALLNDGMHGYDVTGDTLTLTLSGAGHEGDGARETFTYSLLPHAGTWRDGDVTREAAALNHPTYAAYTPAQAGGALPEMYEFASVDAGM